MFFFTSIAALSSLIALSSHASIYEDIQTVWQRHAKINPKSCEAVYFGLFANPTKTNALQSIDLAATFNTVKAITSEKIHSLNSPSSDASVKKEWRRRISLTELKIYSNSDEGLPLDGAFLGFSPKTWPAITTLKPQYACSTEAPIGLVDTIDLNGNPIRPEYSTTPEMLIGFDRAKKFRTSPAAAVFVMGHELAHTLDWIPTKIAYCLSSKASIGAQPSQKFESELFVEMLDSMSRLPFMDFGSGRGTDQIANIRFLLEVGNREAAENILGRLVQQNTLPEQLTESAADYIGAMVVADYITQNFKTPADRRNAALSVLESMPPMLFDKESAKIMNQAGSKKTNEERILRILLANKKFRELIGCEFQTKPAPVECL